MPANLFINVRGPAAPGNGLPAPPLRGDQPPVDPLTENGTTRPYIIHRYTYNPYLSRARIPLRRPSTENNNNIISTRSFFFYMKYKGTRARSNAHMKILVFVIINGPLMVIPFFSAGLDSACWPRTWR